MPRIALGVLGLAVLAWVALTMMPRAAIKSASDSPPASQAPEGWLYETTINPLTRSRDEVASLEALSPAIVAGRPYDVHLLVRGGSTLIVSDALSCRSRSAFFRVRIDDRPIETIECATYSSMPHSEGYFTQVGWFEQAGSLSSPHPELAPRLVGARRLVIQIPTFDGLASVEFNVSGYRG